MALYATLLPVLIVAVLVGVVMLVQLMPSSLAASVDRLARRVNLALDDDVREEVTRFQRRRTLASGLGAIIGGGAAFLLVPADPARAGAIVLGVFGGLAAGAALAALLHARRARGAVGSATIATAGRLTPVGVDDLVPPSERRGMPITAAVAATIVLAAVGILALLDRLDELPTASVVVAVALLAVAAVSTALWWLVAQRIARSRPIGGGTQALAWSDALRSVTLRDMVVLPLTAALYAPLTLMSELLLIAEPPVSTIAGGVLGLLALGALVTAIVMAVVIEAGPSHRRPARHYQRRLWPELADGGAR